MDILLLSLLSCPGALILSAHSPRSSVSLAAFPAGILHAVSHLPTGAPFLPHAHMLATRISAWPPEGCFLLACDCTLPLAWQISQLLCHPVGSTIPSPVMSSKHSLGENPSIGESVPFQGYPSLGNVPQT